jgi:hypothetical protein
MTPVHYGHNFTAANIRFVKPYAEASINLFTDDLEAYLALPPVEFYTELELPKIDDIIEIPEGDDILSPYGDYAAFLYAAPINRNLLGYPNPFWSVVIAETRTGKITNLFTDSSEFTPCELIWSDFGYVAVAYTSENYGTNFLVMPFNMQKADGSYIIWEIYYAYESFIEQGIKFDFEMEEFGGGERKTFPLMFSGGGSTTAEGIPVPLYISCYYEWTDVTGKIQTGTFWYNIENYEISGLEQGVSRGNALKHTSKMR